MNQPMYQSPINLSDRDAINIENVMKITGSNMGAKFDVNTKNFYINEDNKIILTLNYEKFLLHEYHFHVPGEHTINNKSYKSELHFVFIKMSNNYDRINSIKRDICGGLYNVDETDETILVIGKVINNNNELVNLKKLQPKVPCVFFEYDGGLTTGDTATPVRWIVGKNPKCFSIKQIKPFAKGSRILQPLNGRIILKSC